MTETTPSFAALFPATRYFEVDSEHAGARFGIWVTPPANYDADATTSYPIVYQLDGNLYFASTAATHQVGPRDPMSPQIPFILVSIGYSTAESQDWVWLRVRDLLPPGEAVPDLMIQGVEMSVEAGLMPKAEGDRYLAMFAKPAGDKFLAFLQEELHPLMAKTFRVDESNVGLWGNSYGGLFAAYVAIQRSDLFKTIGASSPGIVGTDSRVLKLYEQALTAKKNYADRHLHVTVGGRELSEACVYQSLTAPGIMSLLAETSKNPLPGLKVSTEIIPLESHITGGVPAWFSFLRACYGRA